MATIKNFQDLDIWRLSREIGKEIYDLSSQGTFSKDFELRGQINKSCGSIMDNIAEGFERGGNREFIQFLGIAKGSCGELRSQLFRAVDRNHLTEETGTSLQAKATILNKKINSLISYLNGSDLKGMKFHESESNYGDVNVTNEP